MRAGSIAMSWAYEGADGEGDFWSESFKMRLRDILGVALSCLGSRGQCREERRGRCRYGH